MGQNVSQHEQSQNDGSTIFGYTSLVPPLSSSTRTEHEKQDTLQDHLLSRPFLYGLNNNSFPTITYGSEQGENRADSGLFLLSGKNQLWKDLIYVDQTYYSQQKRCLNIMPERNEAPQFGDALTFRDVLAMNLDNIHEVDLTNRSFRSIEPSIGLLSMIRKLDLSHNYLKEIPEAIGHLHQLEVLSISHNQIQSLPDTICHLSKLTELNLSNNRIRKLTPFIHHLECLQILNLSYNSLEELTYSVEGLQNLVSLDLSNNPIHALPAEITHLPHLRRLRLEGCHFTNSLSSPILLLHNPPSLLEICARHIVKNEAAFLSKIRNIKFSKKKPIGSSIVAKQLKTMIPERLYQYLHSSKPCSHCRGPYFDTFVTRGRWIERNDAWIPLEYRLCSAHWSNEMDRLYSMFSSTTPSIVSKASSVFKLSKPQLINLDSPVLPILTRNRSHFFHKPLVRQLSSTTPVQGLEDRRYQQEQLQEHQQGSIPENSSAVKRWKFKVRNHSSFLKNHRLCL
ncbi:Leucine-rich repeat-containing protein 58 [Choanephora cucurbitarum]|uniref:Leucine-rich repeat-containing protein 58 n=1 Tax=Choanephora cucurbitarum TaxID=101091 RepID=A0A1C7NLL7_9FUNG|nr:Leucine-rich repeat-containing protein 58 [Choanephora cucurbitarum]